MLYARTSPVTLRVLRQDLGNTLGELTTGYVDSGTTTTFTDADLIDSGESETLYDRAWVKISGAVRRVIRDGYDPDTGTITVSRAFTSAPTLSEAYEIHTMLDPNKLDDCINRALTSLFYEQREVITIVADQTEYDLSTYAWITGAEQVTDVFIRIGDTANEYRYTDLPFWTIKRAAAEEGATDSSMFESVYLYTRPLSDTDASIVVVGMCPYAALTSDTLATSAPYDWVMAAAEWNAYDLLTRDAPSTDRKIYEEKREEAGRRMTVLGRQYMPRPRMRVRHPDYTYYMYSPLSLQAED
jgi:hypothetical protein